MRIAYLDEAGIGNLEDEPITVVAGVLVRPDDQWRQLEKRLRELVEKHIPQPERSGFAFHATDLFHGTKKTHRDKYSREQRWAILDELCTMPRELGLPVAFGAINRADFARDYAQHFSAHEMNLITQTTAAVNCTLEVDTYISRTRGEVQDEVCVVVYENNDHIKRVVKSAQEYMKAPPPEMIGALQRTRFTALLPLRHVVDAAHFATKSEASMLQLADACAFAIKRMLMGKPGAERFFDPIKPQLQLEETAYIETGV